MEEGIHVSQSLFNQVNPSNMICQRCNSIQHIEAAYMAKANTFESQSLFNQVNPSNGR